MQTALETFEETNEGWTPLSIYILMSLTEDVLPPVTNSK